MPQQPHSPKPGDPVKLALALCHEVGNLLAAARLSAYLVGRETERDQIQASAEDIETIATQAGAVLAHIRPLLVEGEAARMHVDPAEFLRAVEHSLAQQTPRAPSIELTASDDLPDVLVDADALHHLLVTLVLSAWEAAPGGGGVRLSAAAGEAGVVFALEDGGKAYEAEKVDPQVGPRGRALVLEVAATLVERWSGRVAVIPREVGTRVEILLPAAEE
jgi:signal transduction histidine kinase